MENLTISSARKLLSSGKITSEALSEYYIKRIKEKNNGAVIEVFEDALLRAKECDKEIMAGIDLPLLGVPVLISDNLFCAMKKASCGSKFLENYVAQYTATAVQKLLDAGAVLLGRTCIGEFGVDFASEGFFDGTKCEEGKKCASNGSVAAVKLDLCVAALDSDTGGELRNLAEKSVFVLKPTYGRVSRYGLAAFASSLEQVGTVTKTAEDAALLLKVIEGVDPNDQTSIKSQPCEYCTLEDLKGKKVGIIKEAEEIINSLECSDRYTNFLEFLKGQGAETVEVSLKNYHLALPAHLIISSAEAASNLGRFDGIKYSRRSEKAVTVDDIYSMSRSEGFLKETKKRIMLGNFVLSSGQYETYFKKARIFQQQLSKDTEAAFENCDIIVLPVFSCEGLKSDNAGSAEKYKRHAFDVFANLTGIPAISIPLAAGDLKAPFGVQLMAKKLDEKTIIAAAEFIVKNCQGGGK